MTLSTQDRLNLKETKILSLTAPNHVKLNLLAIGSPNFGAGFLIRRDRKELFVSKDLYESFLFFRCKCYELIDETKDVNLLFLDQLTKNAE